MNRGCLDRSTHAEQTHTSKSCPTPTKSIIDRASKERKADELAGIEDGSNKSLVTRRWTIEGFIEAWRDVDRTQNTDVISGSC